MDIELLTAVLDDQDVADQVLLDWGLKDTQRGRENLRLIRQFGVPLDLLAFMSSQLAEQLPTCGDPDMALNNLEMFVGHARSALGLAALLERDPAALPELVKIFSTSQYLANILINDSGSYDLLRLTEGRPIAREVLIDELCAETESLDDPRDVMRALRRFKRREMLRISYGDLILDQHLSVVTEQISYVADALCEAAFRAASRRLTKKLFGDKANITPPFVILALGKLGGMELNYSSDIDLIYFYDDHAAAEFSPPLDQSFFQRLAQEITKLLSESTELGQAYRVDLRLRPDGAQSAIAQPVSEALRYYDLKARTWERQAYVKSRAAAGDLAVGEKFLKELQPWIYRRYLAAPDIAGIKALKRRIERRSLKEGLSERDVKTGHGGIRDVEFTVQFLQLLNGGEQPDVRTGSTLEAIHRLAGVGCLNVQEQRILEENYRFLRRVEHRLQILFDMQTHELPETDHELQKLAIRMGFVGEQALSKFRDALSSATKLNRRILDHLMHTAFGHDEGVPLEADLVLDPAPDEATINDILAPYGFRDVPMAYRNLMSLAEEQIRFLSTRRCRHFLASVAPTLLTTISRTPDPDATLTNLDRVTASLGGKGALWELFSANQATMILCVELCSISSFLSGILISQPGMLDELIDSLMLNRLPSREGMDAALAELCRGAEDLDPILHSFRNSYLLRIGARDILGKEKLTATTAALSELAECLLQVIAKSAYAEMKRRYGEPRCAAQNETSGTEPDSQVIDFRDETKTTLCRWAVVGVGKFGGRELTYHSDLDLVFLYEGDGQTTGGTKGQSTTNTHFFGELASRITKTISHLGPWGRLYEVDARLRPTGRSGALATSLAEFARYFAGTQGQLWERQAMCKARPVFASPGFADLAQASIWQAAYGKEFTDEDRTEIRRMRARMEEGLPFGNIKRGPGGIADHEFLAQMLRLKHVRLDEGPGKTQGSESTAAKATQRCELRSPTTLTSLQAMNAAGYLPDADWATVREGYLFLRRVQLRHRLMSAVTHDELPQDPLELHKLAHYMGFAADETFAMTCHEHLRKTREVFDRYLGTA